MPEEKTARISTALSCLFPVALLLIIDLYTMFLQPLGKALSHLAFAVLIGQLLCSLVFIRGEICNGQRSRLGRVQAYFALYWAVWFLLSLFSSYHYILTDMICLCGLIMVLTAWKQPQDAQLRRGMLWTGVLGGVVGLMCYLLMLFDLSHSIDMPGWVQYDLVAQILTGVVLANLALLLSHNRLRGFIGLLPLIMAVVVFLNAAIVLIVLIITYFSGTAGFVNNLAVGLYFILHLSAVIILAVPIFRKEQADYPILMILLTISASLPLWATFAHIE